MMPLAQLAVKKVSLPFNVERTIMREMWVITREHNSQTFYFNYCYPDAQKAHTVLLSREGELR